MMSLPQMVLACAFLSFAAAQSIASETLEKLREPHEEALATLDLSSKVAKEKLDRSYLEALEKLQDNYREAGDLDRLIPVKKEAERFAKNTLIGASNKVTDHPPLLDLQNKYIASETKLRERNRAQRVELLREYGIKLTTAKDELTRANQIDEAIAVEAERKRIAEQFKRLSKSAAPAVKTPPVLGKNEFDLPVNKQWPYKTEIKRGETIHIKASGYWRILRGGKKHGPGDKTFYLAARIDGGDMFRVGADYAIKAEEDGTLELTMWEGGKYSNNSGKITVELTRTKD